MTVLSLLFDTLLFRKVSLWSVVSLEILLPFFTHLFVLFYIFWIGSSRSLPGKFSRYVVDCYSQWLSYMYEKSAIYFPFFVKQTCLLGILCNVLDILYWNFLLSWKCLPSLLKFCASNINLLFSYKLLIGSQLSFSYLREFDTRSKHFPFMIILFILITLSFDYVWRKLMLTTLGS